MDRTFDSDRSLILLCLIFVLQSLCLIKFETASLLWKASNVVTGPWGSPSAYHHMGSAVGQIDVKTRCLRSLNIVKVLICLFHSC